MSECFRAWFRIKYNCAAAARTRTYYCCFSKSAPVAYARGSWSYRTSITDPYRSISTGNRAFYTGDVIRDLAVRPGMSRRRDNWWYSRGRRDVYRRVPMRPKSKTNLRCTDTTCPVWTVFASDDRAGRAISKTNRFVASDAITDGRTTETECSISEIQRRAVLRNEISWTLQR